MFDMPEMKITTPNENAVNSFKSSLTFYQQKHGNDKVTVRDTLNNIVSQMRALDGSQLIELTCLTDSDKLIIRVISLSQFDLRLEIAE